MIAIIALMLDLYSFIVLARVIISYFPNIDPNNPLVQFLYAATEPVLQPIREFMQRQFPNMGPIDFSPMILLIGILIFNRLLFSFA